MKKSHKITLITVLSAFLFLIIGGGAYFIYNATHPWVDDMSKYYEGEFSKDSYSINDGTIHYNNQTYYAITHIDFVGFPQSWSNDNFKLLTPDWHNPEIYSVKGFDKKDMIMVEFPNEEMSNPIIYLKNSDGDNISKVLDTIHASKVSHMKSWLGGTSNSWMWNSFYSNDDQTKLLSYLKTLFKTPAQKVEVDKWENPISILSDKESVCVYIWVGKDKQGHTILFYDGDGGEYGWKPSDNISNIINSR
ncbi:MAG: hypothetical protein FWE43_03375 [Streptococcaceae bacterium]|nr:hypothetical protein [Streptococcaceae bacterium]MCL2681505.1 hypothetical protein [Streptococcaceae bacterium]